MSYFSEVSLNTDNPVGDAFGRLRISQPETLFDSKQLHDNQPVFWDDQEVSGSGTTSTHSTARASTTIGVAASTAGLRMRQTYQRFNYQPGKSQFILMTGILQKTGAGQAGIKRGFGYGDDNNGIFLIDDEGTVKIVVRSNVTGTPVDNEVAQSAWTGEGAADIDFTKAHIFEIDIEWLGVGRVRTGFNIDGVEVYEAIFNHAGIVDSVYMSSPNLPLRYWIENTGSGGAAELEHICASVISEGGNQELGLVLDAGTDGTHVDCNTENVIYMILAIRLKSTHLDKVVKLLSANLQIHTASETGMWRLYLNPTVTGSVTWTGQTDSAVEIGTGNGITITAGTGYQVGSGFGGSGGNQAGAQGDLAAELKTSRYLGAAIDGTRDEIYFTWMPNGGTSGHDVEGSLIWREL